MLDLHTLDHEVLFATHTTDLSCLLHDDLGAPQTRCPHPPHRTLVFKRLHQTSHFSECSVSELDGANDLWEPDYIRARFNAANFAPSVFYEIAAKAPGPDLSCISLKAEEIFWNEFGGYLIGPRMLSTLESHEGNASGLITEVEHARVRIFDAPNVSSAITEHACLRVRMVALGAGRYFADAQVAVGGLFCDYLLLQRAVAEDVRRASRTKGQAESTAARLAQLDRQNRVLWKSSLAYVRDSGRIADCLWDHDLGVDLEPAGTPERLREYVQGRADNPRWASGSQKDQA